MIFQPFKEHNPNSKIYPSVKEYNEEFQKFRAELPKGEHDIFSALEKWSSLPQHMGRKGYLNSRIKHWDTEMRHLERRVKECTNDYDRKKEIASLKEAKEELASVLREMLKVEHNAKNRIPLQTKLHQTNKDLERIKKAEENKRRKSLPQHKRPLQGKELKNAAERLRNKFKPR